MSPLSSPFAYRFRPSLTSGDDHHLPPPAPPLSTKPNITTYLYHTDHGLFSLTWSRSILGRSLHINLRNHPFDSPPSFSPSSSFTLRIKPFPFWKKNGSKRISSNTHIFWNFNRAKFGSGHEPKSGFYIAVVVDTELVLLVGDLVKDAYAKSKVHEPRRSQHLILKREHVISDKIYTTGAKFGGKMREIQIDCGYNDETRLCFWVDNERVLQIKHLKWKFRGNDRIEVDGVPIHISWDVYNWLFDNEKNDRNAIFMFKFEDEDKGFGERNLTNLWAHQSWNMGSQEMGKMRNSMSWSSVSMSSSARSLGGSSSVMEWASTEENELLGPIGFSLVVYAWKR